LVYQTVKSEETNAIRYSSSTHFAWFQNYLLHSSVELSFAKKKNTDGPTTTLSVATAVSY